MKKVVYFTNVAVLVATMITKNEDAMIMFAVAIIISTVFILADEINW